MESPDVRLVTETALESFKTNLKDDYTPNYRGPLPNGADLEDYAYPQFAGSWHMPASSTYINAGERTGQNETLHVEANATSAVLTITGFNSMRYRQRPAGSWGLWRYVADNARLLNRGSLPDGANLDDYASPEFAGAWHMPASSTYINAGERTGQNETLFVAPTGTSVTQSIYGYNAMRYRQRPGTTWGLWRYIAEKTRQASKLAIGPTHSQHITSLTDPGVKAFDKDGSTPDRPLSTTKMFTLYVARTMITDALLDALVTVTVDDVDPGGSGDVTYQVGDRVSYRDLIYAMMLSSSNWSAELIARAVGDQMPGEGTGRDKFLDKMREYADTWGWDGFAVSTPSGLGSVNRFSTDMLADLALRMAPDEWACQVTRTREWTVNISGTNPRTSVTKHAFDWDGPIDFSDVVALKGGSGGGYYNLIVLWKTRTGQYCSTALIGSDTEQRNQDLRYVMNLTAAELDRAYVIPQSS